MFEKETNEFEVGKVVKLFRMVILSMTGYLRPVLVGVAKKSNENNNDKKLKLTKIKK